MINTATPNEMVNDLETARSGYPALWQQVIGDWSKTRSGNHAWLTYSANYLFSCDGYKWGLDPFSMTSRVAGMVPPDYSRDLAPLSLVVLSHAHNDHLDMNLVKVLENHPIQWIIPADVQDRIHGWVSIPEDRILTPEPGKKISIGAIQLTPFESLHLHGKYGLPETGYLLETDSKSWLFPGDIRFFDFQCLPDFGKLDGVFAHLWLGKACALRDDPPFLDAFCDFFAAFDTDRLIITHLNEFGRDELDLWRGDHFEMVYHGLLRNNPRLRIEKALTGHHLDLDDGGKNDR